MPCAAPTPLVLSVSSQRHAVLAVQRSTAVGPDGGCGCGIHRAVRCGGPYEVAGVQERGVAVGCAGARDGWWPRVYFAGLPVVVSVG